MLPPEHKILRQVQQARRTRRLISSKWPTAYHLHQSWQQNDSRSSNIGTYSIMAALVQMVND